MAPQSGLRNNIYMKNILIITAHPSSRGFTHKIAATFKEVSESKGDSVEILDLYKPENRQEFLDFENIKEMPEDPSVVRMQEKITWANELVFVFPLWWYGEPAIMKNFWDKNFTARFAYRYIDGKPVGLFKGKTGRVFFTSDGSWFYQWLLLNPVKHIWWLTRFGLCGIKLKSFTVFGSMFKRDDAAREKLLVKVRKAAF